MSSHHHTRADLTAVVAAAAAAQQHQGRQPGGWAAQVFPTGAPGQSPPLFVYLLHSLPSHQLLGPVLPEPVNHRVRCSCLEGAERHHAKAGNVSHSMSSMNNVRARSHQCVPGQFDSMSAAPLYLLSRQTGKKRTRMNKTGPSDAGKRPLCM